MISQLVDEKQIPEFDNLYLDMNSILHTCTHSNDGSITRISDDQMYAAIFNYIDHLFSIIKPKKTFYMAIDGVAPRAKMNQQRARRFRTAYEAEINLKKAIENGDELPKEDPFDSNSITPGTEFMAKLTENLKYFVHKKITEDSRWANIEIVLSGHEVPGEGEHKIQEFIRAVRSQDDYDPNLRHCIYGLDADLIMLGLVSHDPHFALLREEVTFGNRKTSSGPKDVTDQKFYLLHLSLVREYLELEFKEVEEQVDFEYDFEKVLDDFILIMYVIGNDFLPHLPDLHLNKGAFPLLLSTFKQSLLQSDGYINEEGKINLRRLNIWVHHLSEFEFENFEEREVDVEWFNKKLDDVSISGEKKRKKIGKLLILKEQKKLVGYIKPWLMEVSSQTVNDLIQLANEDKLPTLKLNKEDVEKNLDFLKQFALEAGFLIIHSKSDDSYVAKLDIDGLSPAESEEDYDERISELRKTVKSYQAANLVESQDVLGETKGVYEEKFKTWKNNYYEEKLHFPIDDKEKLIEMTEHYVEGLQWVLYYYYRGCPSWNFYYKYHYAPRISDVSLGLEELIKKGVDITFEKSKPFKPFEQLMAVLPARSKKLMPAAYWPLMTDEKSPIIDFYPHEVDIDMNGKTASWEAVVLLDFVDEKKLLDALKPIESKLTPQETKRNSYGHNIKFINNPQIDKVYPSPLPGFFHDIEHDKCYETEFVLPEVVEPKIGKLAEARTGTDLLAGFPTLKYVPFTSELALNEVKVFNFSSKSETMILNVENVWSDMTLRQFAQSFAGKLIYSNWPFLRECKVVKVVDGEYNYESVRNTKGFKHVVTTDMDPEEKRSYRSTCNNLDYYWDKTKGVKLGPIEVLVHVKAVNGLIRNPNGAYVKTYSKDIEVYPLQLIVKDVTHKDQRFATRPPLPIEEEFPVHSQVILLGDLGYGAPAQVVGYSGDKLSIRVSKISSTAEPNIGKRRQSIEAKQINYVPSFDVSKKLAINPLLLSKITSLYMIQDGNKKINIGLELKFQSKRQKVLGYTKQLANGKFWEFSPLAINLIQSYRQKFPKLFAKLSQLKGSDIPNLKDVSDADEIQEVKKWLKEVKADLIPVSLESQSFTKFSFGAIEQYMENYILTQVPMINKDIRGVPRNAILNASESYQLLSDQKFELGDRVEYVQDFGKVPKMSKGTVVSIITVGSKTSLGVIFDVPQLSGNNMNGKLQSNRGLLLDSSLVLNLTNRQFVYHSRASKQRKPMTEEEKVARIKASQAKKTHKPQSQGAAHTVEKKTGSAASSENGQTSSNPTKSKGSNELLSLLRKKLSDKSANIKEFKGVEAADKETQDEQNQAHNPQAAKQIYNQIYSNVMSEGSYPVNGGPYVPNARNGPQYGQPIPPPAPYGFPPGAYYQQHPYPVPPSAASASPAAPPTFPPQQNQLQQQRSGSNGAPAATRSSQEGKPESKEPNAIDRFLNATKKSDVGSEKDQKKDN